MQLGKFVSIACLTYIVYGVTSTFQLGTFLPPLPLKPFIYLLFVLVGIIYGIQQKTNIISYSLLGWLALFAFNSTSFLELIFNTEQIIHYERHISVIISLIMMILFSLHSLILIFGVMREDKRFGVFLIPVLVGIVYHFIESVSVPFGVLIVGWALLVLILDRIFEERLPGLFLLGPILYGAGIIEVVEFITLYVA